MKNLKNLGIILVVAAMTNIACNNSNRNDSLERAETMNDSTAQVNADDASFAVHAADLNMSTIELSNVAESRVRDARLKAIASTLHDEHESAHAELAQISSNKMITLPMSLSGDRRDDVRDLQERDTTNFDRNYLDRLIDQHEEARKLYEDASNDVRDAELQAFAAKHLPIIKRHEEQLKSIWDSLGYERNMPNVVPATQ